MKQNAFELAVTIAEEQLERTRAAATITLSLAVDIFLTAQYALRVAREGDALPPAWMKPASKTAPATALHQPRTPTPTAPAWNPL